MIESVVPIGAIVREGDAELGVTWLLIGDDWMVLDYATRGVEPPSLLALIDDQGRSYAPMGAGAMGDATGTFRHQVRFREALHPRATELVFTLLEAREDGRNIASITVPVPERVQRSALRVRLSSDAAPFTPVTGTCLECGHPSPEWRCSQCRDEGTVISAHRSGQLVPELIGPVSGDLNLVDGSRHAVAGILAWENTFMVRFVFAPVPTTAEIRRHQAPDPVVGRWTAEDAASRTFVGRPRQSGMGTSGDRTLGDATVEFMPALDAGAGPLVLKTGPPGHPVLELELPLEPRG